MPKDKCWYELVLTWFVLVLLFLYCTAYDLCDCLVNHNSFDDGGRVGVGGVRVFATLHTTARTMVIG